MGEEAGEKGKDRREKDQRHDHHHKTKRIYKNNKKEE